jgi:hypothetical protein
VRQSPFDALKWWLQADFTRAVMNDQNVTKRLGDAARRALAEAEERRKAGAPAALPREVNGAKGPEPTRFGDWERKGLTSDF